MNSYPQARAMVVLSAWPCSSYTLTASLIHNDERIETVATKKLSAVQAQNFLRKTAEYSGSVLCATPMITPDGPAFLVGIHYSNTQNMAERTRARAALKAVGYARLALVVEREWRQFNKAAA